jgi:hypothetical protein
VCIHARLFEAGTLFPDAGALQLIKVMEPGWNMTLDKLAGFVSGQVLRRNNHGTLQVPCGS